MQAVIDSLVSVVTGVFTLGEADLMTIGINMIMALSMFLPMTVGQLSFGQAGFMSIGAHIAVVLTLYASVSFPIALLVAGLGRGLVGFLVRAPVLRLRGLLLAPVPCAFAPGVGGGLYAHHAVFIQYDNFDFKRGVDIAMYMVLGGMDVLYGPLLGAFVITYLSTALQFLSNWRWEVWGSIVILVMIFRPQGILGRDTLTVRRWLRARKE